ncbi:MAG TPA: hypothetical protein VGM76_06060 [Lacipirellulaceae bacterium]
MTNPEHIDDEMLSAYLDNELAPQERARVEERLAADPAARQLLEQLRAVSQAVKDLPAAPLGTDLRDVVLRRAERAMLVSNPGESAAADGNSPRGSNPRFTIGRSVRGWVWAGLATAAGLAIMAFESNSDRDAQLPESVAERSAQPTGESKPSPELRALVKTEQPAAPSEAADSRSPETPPAPEGGAAISTVAGDESSIHGARDQLPALSDIAATAPQQKNLDQLQVATHKDVGISGRGGGRLATGNSGIAGATTRDSDSAAENLLVVRVQVRPEAFAGRAFDRVLASNRIAVEEPADDSAAAAVAPNGAPLSAGSSAQNETLNSAPAIPARENSPVMPGTELALSRRPQTQNDQPQSNTSTANPATGTDVILVEAPKEQIESCLAEIHKNDHDYLGVAVDEDETLKRKASTADRGANWSQYARGIVSQQERLQQAADSNYFLQTRDGPVTIDRGENRGANEQQTEHERSLAQKDNKLAEQNGRAFRMKSQLQQEPAQPTYSSNARALRLDSDRAQLSSANARSGFAGIDNKEMAQEERGQRAADTIQVLFVLSPGDEPATSPPPAGTKAAK